MSDRAAVYIMRWVNHQISHMKAHLTHDLHMLLRRMLRERSTTSV
jgi:hypothetical protein